MISQPMRGLTAEEIEKSRSRAIEYLEANGYEVINNYFPDFLDFSSEEVLNIPVYYLAKSIAVLSKCEAVYFLKGWEDARGCLMEYNVAISYGIECIYESDTVEQDNGMETV